MKFTSIFSIILLAHMGLIGLLLVQPGCKSQSLDSGPPPAQTTQAPRSGGGQVSETPQRQSSGDLDPAFNAGLNGSSTAPTESRSGSRSLAAPTRPSQPETSAPSRSRPSEDLSAGILQPLGGDDAARASTSRSAATREFRSYEVQSGDTLTHIARREGISLAELLEANGLNRDSTIFVGQSLQIPGSTNGDSASARSASPASSSGTTYEVRSGDTLSGIASRHNTTVAQIRSANQLRSDTIRVGQTLVIPNGGDRAEAAPRSDAGATRSTSGNGQVHTVQSGETPSHIARRYGVSVAALMEANGITDARRIQVGQRLTVPGSAPASSTASSTPAPRERSESAPRRTETGTTTTSRNGGVSLIDSTTRPRNIEDSTSQPSIMDLELLDDEDLPFADVERVED